MSLHKATPEQVPAAAGIGLSLTLKRLIACQNRLYRGDRHLSRRSGGGLQRLEFLLHGMMAGLVTPMEAKAGAAKPDRSGIQ